MIISGESRQVEKTFSFNFNNNEDLINVSNDISKDSGTEQPKSNRILYNFTEAVSRHDFRKQ